MRVTNFHSHLNGHEWLLVHAPQVWEEIEGIVSRVDAAEQSAQPSSRRVAGSSAYRVAVNLEAAFVRELQAAGWRRRRTGAGFVKRRVAAEVRLGVGSVEPHDFFANHLALYVGDAIDLGIAVLSVGTRLACMPSSPNRYELAVREIARTGRGVPAVPLLLVGVSA